MNRLTDRIFCYYAELGYPDQWELVELWKERWSREGWNPVVLRENLAMQDPRYSQMLKKAASFPCVNDRVYERANFERWLAFSTIDGAIADYDVFPMRRFPPREFPGFFCADDMGGPGFIVGQRKDFSKVADFILGYETHPEDQVFNKPHVSDMLILHRLNKARLVYDNIKVIIHGWRANNMNRFPLVHFTSGSLEYITKRWKIKPRKAFLVRRLLSRVYP